MRRHMWDIVNDLIRTQISANVMHTHIRKSVTMCNRWWLFNRLKCISIRRYGANFWPIRLHEFDMISMLSTWDNMIRPSYTKNQLNIMKISLICDVRIILRVLDWNALSTLVYSLQPKWKHHWNMIERSMICVKLGSEQAWIWITRENDGKRTRCSVSNVRKAQRNSCICAERNWCVQVWRLAQLKL